MAVARIVSGSFAILSGTAQEVLGELYSQGVRADHRIVGFSVMGADYVVMYAL